MLTGKGTDHVTYELDGNLQPNTSQFVEVGSAKRGGGPVMITVNVVGKVLDQASLVALAFPKFNKKTTMTVNDSGEIDGTSQPQSLRRAPRPSQRRPRSTHFRRPPRSAPTAISPRA